MKPSVRQLLDPNQGMLNRRSFIKSLSGAVPAAGMEHGVAMAMHFAGSPISFRANVHCAAATENFIALEHHSMDVPWWEAMVRTRTPLVDKGFAPVPEEPGLGIDDLVPEVIKQHLHPDHPGYFEPTPEWDKDRVDDRLWS